MKSFTSMLNPLEAITCKRASSLKTEKNQYDKNIWRDKDWEFGIIKCSEDSWKATLNHSFGLSDEILAEVITKSHKTRREALDYLQHILPEHKFHTNLKLDNRSNRYIILSSMYPNYHRRSVVMRKQAKRWTFTGNHSSPVDPDLLFIKQGLTGNKNFSSRNNFLKYFYVRLENNLSDFYYNIGQDSYLQARQSLEDNSIPLTIAQSWMLFVEPELDLSKIF